MSEMERPVPIDRIGTGGLAVTVDAGPDELAAIAARLMIPAVARLHCEFELKRLENAIIAAHGRLAGEVTQTCVVSLDDFQQRVDESFDVLFVPAGTESDDPDPEAPDELPYPDGAIDLGEAAIEQLALSLDPYPRKSGLDEPVEEAGTTPNPFAALAALRRPQ